MTKVPHAEIVVVGGGPAGCTAAMRLAALGHEVLLLERRPFPRPHVGEALSPGVVPMLDRLGVGEDVRAARFLAFTGADVRWSTDDVEHRAAPSLTVDRGRFDHILLGAARRRGVRVLQPASARRAARSGTGWHIGAETPDGRVTVAASYIVDAAGRAGFLPRRCIATSPPTVALYGYWRGGRLPRIPRIEAGERQWYWGSPVPDGRFNAMVFVDPRDFRRRGRSLAACYGELVDQSTLLAGAHDARPETAIRACDATCHADALSIGPGYIKVGEAAVAIDPLSSSGVQKAIQTALAASVIVHTILARPDEEATARQFHLDDQRRSVAQHARWSAQSFAAHRRHAHADFWRHRAAGSVDPPTVAPSPVAWSPGDSVRLSPDVAVTTMPCLVGDFVELRPAVSHPALDRPVAFVGGISLADLLTNVRPGSASDLVDTLSRRVAPTASGRLVDWLFRHHLIEIDAAERSTPQPSRSGVTGTAADLL